jgi:hypothetical protein
MQHLFADLYPADHFTAYNHGEQLGVQYQQATVLGETSTQHIQPSIMESSTVHSHCFYHRHCPGCIDTDRR